MLVPAAILIIDSDPHFTNEIRAIFEFLDQVVIVNNNPASWQSDLKDAGAIKAIVARFDYIADTLPALLLSINKFDSRLPVIIIQGQQIIGSEIGLTSDDSGEIKQPPAKQNQ